MAVRLRLRRIGKKKQPQYRLVAAEAAGPRDGRFIEALGHYNPRLDPPVVSVNEERALWWLEHGAQPTDTAKSLLVKTGVWEKFTGEPAPVRAAPVAAAPVAAAAAVAPPASEAAPAEGPAAADSAEEEEAAATPEASDQEEAAATPEASDQEEAAAPDSGEQDAAAASEEGPAAEEQEASPGETTEGTEEAAKADS